MADLFGDETIEIVDMGGKEAANLDTAIECPVPAMCEEICTKRTDEKANDYAFETREAEAGYAPEEQILPESGDRLTREMCKSLQTSDARCCIENNTTMCSSTMIHHIDQKAQAEIRKTELEELRQLSLAKHNAAKLGDASAPTEMTEFFDKQKEMSLEQRRNQRDAIEFLHKYRDDGQRVLGGIRRTLSKDSACSIRRGVTLKKSTLSDAVAEVTEEELALQRLLLLQQSTERVKRFEDLHVYRGQNALIECSSGESGTPIPKKPDHRLVILNTDSPTTILEVDHTRNDGAEQSSTRPNNKEVQEQNTKTEVTPCGDRRVVLARSIKAHGGELPIPNGEKVTEACKRSEEHMEDAPLLQASVDDLASTLLLSGNRSNSLGVDTPIDAHAVATEPTRTKDDIVRQDTFETPFVGCQFGCLEIRVNLDGAYTGVRNLTNALSSPNCGSNNKDTLVSEAGTSPKAAEKINLAGGKEDATAQDLGLVGAPSKPSSDDSNDEARTKSKTTSMTKTVEAARDYGHISIACLCQESSPRHTSTEQAQHTLSSFQSDLGSRTVAVECESLIGSPNESSSQQTSVGETATRKATPKLELSIDPCIPDSPQATPVKQSESKLTSPNVARVSRIVAPKLKSPIGTPNGSLLPQRTPGKQSQAMSSSRQTERVSRVTAPKLQSTAGSMNGSPTPRRPRDSVGRRTVRSIADYPPKHEDCFTPTKMVLTNVPLYVRGVARQKPDRESMCSLKYVPQLHKSRAACERCLYWASADEKERFEATGYHLRIMKCRGGCDRDCAVFPRMKNEFPVRLCKKCFFDTHVVSKQKEDDETSSVLSKSSAFSNRH